MPGAPSSPTCTLVETAYHAIEEVDEVARATGWRAEYRQMGKGPINSEWRSLHLGRASLVTHQLDNRVHARVAPPEGSVALTLMPPPSSMRIEGAEFGSSQVLVVDMETDIVVPAGTRNDTLVLPRLVYDASVRALFPEMSAQGGLFCWMKVSTSGWSALQQDLQALLCDGTFCPEDLSRLLCGFLGLIAGETDEHPGEACLGNRSTAHVSRLSQDYIEDHYAEPIRMEDLCRHAGVSMRTLQRSFSEYFDVSPFDYVKTRRLNAARKALAAGDPSRDSVTRIAVDNGFAHLGRFSIDYRGHFDESPKETLRRLPGAGAS